MSDGTGIGPTDLPRVVRREAVTLADLVAGVPAATPVPTCPDWTIADLVTHVGLVHRWALDAVHTSPEAPLPPWPGTGPDAPTDWPALVSWFRHGADTLADGLAIVDPAAPCRVFGGAGVASFWMRRQALETAVHRVDAERAVASPGVLDASLAGAGLAEVRDVLLPRAVRRGAGAPDTALRLAPTEPLGPFDLGATDGAPGATVHGTASDLYLALWRRVPFDDRFRIDGDRERARAFFAAVPTP